MNVSVIIPVYNAQLTIDKAVSSVLSQLDVNDEIILVDDGSRDQSGQMCDDLARIDHRIMTVHQTNQGTSAARNAGIEIATKEYVVFVEADDVWNAGVWKLVKQAMDEHAETSVIMFDFELYDTLTQMRTPHRDYHPVSNHVVDGIQFVKQLGKYATDFGISVMRFVVKRQLMIDLRVWFEVGKYYEDALWTFQMLLVAPSVYYVPVVVFAYSRNVPNQITSGFSAKKLFDRLWICSYWLQEIGKFLTDQEDIDRFLRRISVMYFTTLIAIREQPVEVQKELLPELVRLKAYLDYPHSVWHRLASGLCQLTGIDRGSKVFHAIWRLHRIFS